MATKSKITDARREVLYAELHALLTAGLDFSHTFALLTEGERDVRVKGLLERLYGVCPRRSTSCAITTANAPPSGGWSLRR